MKKLIIWILFSLLFSYFIYAAYQGTWGYTNISKDRIYARDGSKRSPHYRGTYYGGAYRYGK